MRNKHNKTILQSVARASQGVNVHPVIRPKYRAAAYYVKSPPTGIREADGGAH